MDWLAQNWIWILFAVAFVATHMFGHGATVATARIRAVAAMRAPSRRGGRKDPAQ